MRTAREELSRAAVAVLVASFCGVIAWFAAYSVGWVDTAALGSLLLLAGVIGLGCGLGQVLAHRTPAGIPLASHPRHRLAWPVWSAGAVAVGLPFGAFLGTAFARRIFVAPPVFLALTASEALAAGLLIGHSAALQSRYGVFIRALAAAAAGLLQGYAFGLAYGAAWAILYRSACAPHAYCLDRGPLAGLYAGLIVGPIGGLALGIIAALALATAFSARDPAHRSPRAASS